MASQQNVIAEWRHVPINSATLAEALDWRNPNSSYFWLLGFTVVAALVALKRKRLGPSFLLLGSAYLSIQHIRFQGLFSSVAVVVAAPFLASLVDPGASKQGLKISRAERRRAQPKINRTQLSFGRFRLALIGVGLAIIAGLVGIRAYDLVTQQAYVRAADVNLFGAGISSWYPERAASFILREQLPGNIFHDYNLGGFLSFRLGPKYPDYIDGRAIPFGSLMAERRSLMRQSPDNAAWQQEADKRGINTLMFSLARYWGLTGTSLRQFCTSVQWTAVYLDELAIVLVRNRPENSSWIKRLQVNCNTVQFDPLPEMLADQSTQGRAEQFNFYAHAGSILFKLSRYGEAALAIDRAIQMFPDEPFLHQIRGQVYEASGRPAEAEREYLLSARLKPAEVTWYTLATLYFSERRYDEAARALQRAADLSLYPSQYYISLGKLYVSIGQPEKALRAFDAAAANSSYESAEMKAQSDSQVAEGRARVSRAQSAAP